MGIPLILSHAITWSLWLSLGLVWIACCMYCWGPTFIPLGDRGIGNSCIPREELPPPFLGGVASLKILSVFLLTVCPGIRVAFFLGLFAEVGDGGASTSAQTASERNTRVYNLYTVYMACTLSCSLVYLLVHITLYALNIQFADCSHARKYTRLQNNLQEVHSCEQRLFGLCT